MSRTSAAKHPTSVFRSELELLERRDTPGSLLGDLAVLLAPPLLGETFGRLAALPTTSTTTSGTGDDLELVALPATPALLDDARPLAVAPPVQSQASSPTGPGVGTVSGVVNGPSLNDPLLNVAFFSGPVAHGVFAGAESQTQSRPATLDVGPSVTAPRSSQSDSKVTSSSDLASSSVSTPAPAGMDLGAPAPVGAPPSVQSSGAPLLLYPGFTLNGSTASYQTISSQQFSNYAAYPVPVAIVEYGMPMMGRYTYQPKPPTYATVSISSGALLRGIPNAGGFDVQFAPSFTFTGLPSEINAQIARELWFVKPPAGHTGSTTLSVTSDDYNFNPNNGDVTNIGPATRTVTWQETPYDGGAWVAAREDLKTTYDTASGSTAQRPEPLQTPAFAPQLAGNARIVRGIDLNSIRVSQANQSMTMSNLAVTGTVWTANTWKGTQIKLFEAKPYAQQSGILKQNVTENVFQDFKYNCHGFTFGLSSVVVNGQARSFWIHDPNDVKILVAETLTYAQLTPSGDFPPHDNPQFNQTVFVFYDADGTPVHSCVLSGNTVYRTPGPNFAVDPDATPVVTKNGNSPLEGADGTYTLKKVESVYANYGAKSTKMYFFNKDSVPGP